MTKKEDRLLKGEFEKGYIKGLVQLADLMFFYMAPEKLVGTSTTKAIQEFINKHTKLNLSYKQVSDVLKELREDD